MSTVTELVEALLGDGIDDETIDRMMAEDDRDARALGFCSATCGCEWCRKLDDELRSERD